MKKILLILVVGLCLCYSCAKDDSLDVDKHVEYTMPFMSLEKTKVKAELSKISTNVVEKKIAGKTVITCVPNAARENMFSSLTYTFSYEGFDVTEFNFTYTIDPALTVSEDDRKKLADYMKTIIL